MPVTMRQVRARLDPEEPDYARAAQLGPDAVPHLLELVQSADPMLASKAAYLASLIPSDQSVDVLELASRSSEAIVRAAAAAGLQHLQQVPEPLAGRLLADPEVSVRKVTLRSVEKKNLTAIRGQLAEVAATDPEPALRALADEVLQQSP